MNIKTIKEWVDNLSSSRKMILGFLSSTIIGSFVLMLPFALQEGETLNLLESLFIITSAICVTGLSVVDVSKVFTPAGQMIILIFIQ